ncbi:MAG: hypothetical protein Q9216_002198 [Gyalolechia sp. 2 TL-2023]
MVWYLVYSPFKKRYHYRIPGEGLHLFGTYFDQVQRLQLPLSERHGLPPTPTSVGTILFDTQQDLLWIGTDSVGPRAVYPDFPQFSDFVKGRVVSYYGSELQRYVSSQAHPTQEGPTRRRYWSLDARAICTGSTSTKVSLYNKYEDSRLANTWADMEKVSSQHEYMLMRYCRYICAATNSGAINFLDPDTLDVIKSWQAYSSKVSDMDAQSNYLVTCGWSSRPYGGAFLESFAKVYDLRKLEQLPPIPFHGGAAYVQLHPKLSTTSILSSAIGQIQVVDLMNPNTSNLHQVILGNYMSHLVLAPSGAAWAIADNDGVVQIWGLSRSKLRFTESAALVEFADEDIPPPSMGIESDLPLSTVGMPYYREKLLSVWSEDPVYELGFLPPKIDAEVLKHMSPSGIGFRAHNPKNTLRNQMDRLSIIDSNGIALAAPKFLSEKSLETNGETGKERRISDAEAFTNPALVGSVKAEVPAMYRLMEIKYSRYGVDDFDFGYYNKTQHSGLETHITNSYLNPLLQLFKYTPLFRNLTLHHTASSCLAESCLLCELGYLFDMLEKAEGQKCHATNFLKAFGSLGEAAKLQLTEETSPQSTLEVRIQAANRFLLKQIGMDYQRIAPGDGKLDQNLNPRMRSSTPAFSRVLKDSFERDNNQRMWCDRCRRYQLVQSWETVQNVPPVLMINTGLNKQTDGRQLWSIPGWLPEKIGIGIDKGRVLCLEGEALRVSQRNRQARPLIVYDLVGLVADVNSGEHQKSHMVSLINVAISSREVRAEPQWHLFNDFLVRKIDKDEALRFATTWKTPTILAYQYQGASNVIDDTWKSSLDTSCLFANWSLNPYNVLPNNWPCVLDPATEQPGVGTHVPIDTEFVRLQQEEIEILATGDRQVIRPTREGLARVSVLRASGSHEGLPFIDDYISISEPVVDYVTKYSGVSAGDLDPGVSVHPLVPLKVAYKKLWLLLNLGCIFVGHGLIKDFRNIDIFVPKSQIVDTVTLFYNPARSKRNLSLRFLAWYLLKENIQSSTHDSIEDALTALKLWRKYEEFQDAGIVEQMIDEIYTAGRKLNYKAPEKGSEKGIGGLVVPRKGRNTPDVDSGMSGPSTPVNKKIVASEYFDSPLSVRRSELRSKSFSPETSSEETRTQWQWQLDLVYNEQKPTPDIGKTENGDAAIKQAVEDPDEQAYEFRLFSARSDKPRGSGDQPPKVHIGSPKPASREPGFVHPRRPEVYCFPGSGEAARIHYEATAIEGEEILKEARVKWVRKLHCYPVLVFTALLTTVFQPGFELPWRVTTLTSNYCKRSSGLTTIAQAESTGKRKRSGKKKRIAMRIRTQAQRRKEEDLRQAESCKQELEREKRNRRNREKKVKKREKARAMKRDGI